MCKQHNAELTKQLEAIDPLEASMHREAKLFFDDVFGLEKAEKKPAKKTARKLRESSMASLACSS